VLLVPLSTLFHLVDSCDVKFFDDQSLIFFVTQHHMGDVLPSNVLCT
jgi:hypothetical protein